jgi:septal ring-binding cell division protein DamX
MLVAVAVFVAVVAGGVLALGHLPGKLSKNSKLQAPDAGVGATPALFYSTIGQGGVETGDAPDARPGASRSSYTLEIKVAKSREEAEELIDSLHLAGIDAYYTPLSRAGRVVYRVRRGIYTNQSEATKAAGALAQGAKIKAKVVKLQ